MGEKMGIGARKDRPNRMTFSHMVVSANVLKIHYVSTQLFVQIFGRPVYHKSTFGLDT